jgi:ribonuclease BN (tRNA processing enzyme)
MSQDARWLATFLAVATMCSGMSLIEAQEVAAREATFVTLGTMGGPIPHPHRSQAANALIHGSEVILVDCGDGAAEQLARAGLRLGSIRAVFLSHLHFDHTAGLAGILGLRHQTNVRGVLEIYGPPGTKQLVDGLIASMRPAAEAGYGFEGQTSVAPAEAVRAIEIVGGSKVQIGDVQVTAAQNTHYSFAKDSPMDRRFKSLAFRLDLPERSIVYTGDTGPSGDVEVLASNADLLVSEMIDVAATVENVKRNSPTMPERALEQVVRHLTQHHLTAEQVGQLAARAQVKRVVVTHVVPGSIDSQQLTRYKAQIAKHFKGPVTVASDLDRF